MFDAINAYTNIQANEHTCLFVIQLRKLNLLNFLLRAQLLRKDDLILFRFQGTVESGKITYVIELRKLNFLNFLLRAQLIKR